MDIGRFFRKPVKIFVAVISIVLQFANIFLGNIAIYEVTEGITFNWIILFQNRWFWVITILNIIYYAVSCIVKENVYSVDEKLEAAISDSSVKLLNIATDSAKEGDFESSKKAIKILDKIQKRRKK